MKLLNVKSVDEVKGIIRENFQALSRYEELELEDCLGRVLAEDVLAKENLPPFARSSVDGYAVSASDTYGAGESLPAFLQCIGEIKMGEGAEGIRDGETFYIPTGGMLPQGADSVVMVEYTERLADQIMAYRQVAPGENVIKAGDDVKEGDRVIKKGTVLKGAELGALAALGIKKVKVFAQPIVGILSTGNELVSRCEENLKVGQIRDINSILLASIVRKYGGKVIYGGIAVDKYDDIFRRAVELYQKVDILLLSGGSSVGTYDYTSQVIGKITGKAHLVEGIAVKPGKPTIFSGKDNKAIWGLPGHPVSAMMIFNYFGDILLNILSGCGEKKFKRKIKGILTRNVPGSAGRTDWIRVKIDTHESSVKITPVFGKSGLVTTLIDSQGYIEIPTQKEGLEAGSLIEAVLWN